MHRLLKIRDGLLRRDSDMELKGSLIVAAAANAAVTTVKERACERLKQQSFVRLIS